MDGKLEFLKNGSVYNDTYGFPIETTGSSTGQELAYVVSMVVDAAANDYFEIEIENIGGAAGSDELWVFWYISVRINI